jgi:hypothetical protein
MRFSTFQNKEFNFLCLKTGLFHAILALSEMKITDFPRLGSRANFAKQAAYLREIKRPIHRKLAQNMGEFEDTLHMVDGFPMPVCELKRIADAF